MAYLGGIDPYQTVNLYVFLILACLARETLHSRIWKTYYMDKAAECLEYIKNDDMAEEDVYLVKSDSWRGDSPFDRRPTECLLSFNLGSRMAAVDLMELWCEKPFSDPYLSIYDNCHAKRDNLLATFNCSSAPPKRLHSSSSCLTLYHYRGHTKYGYFFEMEVVALDEVRGFPAGGIAAVVIASLVLFLVIIKVLCVVLGCDASYDDYDDDDDDEDEGTVDDTVRILPKTSGPQLGVPGARRTMRPRRNSYISKPFKSSQQPLQDSDTSSADEAIGLKGRTTMITMGSGKKQPSVRFADVGSPLCMPHESTALLSKPKTNYSSSEVV